VPPLALISGQLPVKNRRGSERRISAKSKPLKLAKVGIER
jgi:hypothetical protein